MKISSFVDVPMPPPSQFTGPQNRKTLLALKRIMGAFDILLRIRVILVSLLADALESSSDNVGQCSILKI